MQAHDTKRKNTMNIARLNHKTSANQQIAAWIVASIRFPCMTDVGLLAQQNIKAGLEMDIVARLPDAIPDLYLRSIRVANELNDTLWRVTIGHSQGYFDADFVVEA